MHDPLVSELHTLADEARNLHHALTEALTPHEREHVMAALDQLKALGPRIDAVTAIIGATDVAGAVAQATAPLTAQIKQLQQDADAKETAAQAVATSLTTSVGALEAAANGVAQQQPAPATPAPGN